jgi:hypothetical protein
MKKKQNQGAEKRGAYYNHASADRERDEEIKEGVAEMAVFGFFSRVSRALQTPPIHKVCLEGRLGAQDGLPCGLHY